MTISLRTAWLAMRLLPARHPYRTYIEGTARAHGELLRVFGHPLGERRAVKLVGVGLGLAVLVSVLTYLLLADPLHELGETVFED